MLGLEMHADHQTVAFTYYVDLVLFIYTLYFQCDPCRSCLQMKNDADYPTSDPGAASVFVDA